MILNLLAFKHKNKQTHHQPDAELTHSGGKLKVKYKIEDTVMLKKHLIDPNPNLKLLLHSKSAD